MPACAALDATNTAPTPKRRTATTDQRRVLTLPTMTLPTSLGAASVPPVISTIRPGNGAGKCSLWRPSNGSDREGGVPLRPETDLRCHQPTGSRRRSTHLAHPHPQHVVL